MKHNDCLTGTCKKYFYDSARCITCPVVTDPDYVRKVKEITEGKKKKRRMENPS